MSLFASFLVVALLQLVCVVVSFFTPELLFRASGKEQRWHVPAASLFLLATVLTLSWLHGQALQSQLGQSKEVAVSVSEKKPDAPKPSATEDAAQVDFSISTRFGTLPLPVGSKAPLELAIANNGAQAVFGCDLAVLDASGAKPAPQDAVLVQEQKTTANTAPGETSLCSWMVTPRIPGVYVLQASAATAGSTSTQQVRVKVEHNYRVDVDDAVWVFNSRNQSSAEKLAQRLRDAGFHKAIARGEWKTRSTEQYIFYRDEDKANLTELFEEIGDPDVQPYIYNSPRVGSKVKEMFDENPDMGFLVIIH